MKDGDFRFEDEAENIRVVKCKQWKKDNLRVKSLIFDVEWKKRANGKTPRSTRVDHIKLSNSCPFELIKYLVDRIDFDTI